MPLDYTIPIEKGTWLRCCNGVFSPEQLVLITNVPHLDEYYTIRHLHRIYNIITDIEQYTVLLNEVINPKLRVVLENGLIDWVEPCFSLKRFDIVSGPEDVGNSVAAFYNTLKEHPHG
jgi:hypothetical protein